MLEEVDSLFLSSSRIIVDATRVFGVESLNCVATTLVTRCRKDRLLFGGGESGTGERVTTGFFSCFGTTSQLESSLIKFIV